MNPSCTAFFSIFLSLAIHATSAAQSLTRSSAEYIKANAVQITEADPGAALLPIFKDRRIIAIGEIHGTAEMPRFVLDVVRVLLNADRNVALGLEIPSDHQQVIDEARKSGKTDKLRESSFFQRDFQDGRSSRAIADLIIESGQFPRLTVFTFDRPVHGLNLRERDRKMAEDVLAFLAKHPDHTIILFAGNLHTKLTVGTPFDPAFHPLGYYLTNLPGSPLKSPDIASLLIQTERGNYWICPSADPAECGRRDFSAAETPYARANNWPLYMVSEEDPADGYTHTVFIRTVTASPPLKQE